MKRCEMCQRGIGYTVYLGNIFWRLCLGCIADARIEGKRVHREAHRPKVAA